MFAEASLFPWLAGCGYLQVLGAHLAGLRPVLLPLALQLQDELLLPLRLGAVALDLLLQVLLGALVHPNQVLLLRGCVLRLGLELVQNVALARQLVLLALLRLRGLALGLHVPLQGLQATRIRIPLSSPLQPSDVAFFPPSGTALPAVFFCLNLDPPKNDGGSRPLCALL